jgi:oligosaccharide repeat unit polymerase
MEHNIHNKKDNVLMIYLLLLAVIVISSLVLYIERGLNYTNSLTLLSLSVIILGLLFIPELVRRRNDIFEPINFVILAVLIGVTLRVMLIIFGEKDFIEYRFFIRDSIGFLIQGGIIILIGLISFIFGYLIKVKPLNKIRSEEIWDKKRLFITFWALILTSIIATIDFIKKAGIGFSDINQISNKRAILIESTNLAYTSLGYHRLGALLISLVFLIYLAWFIVNKKKFKSIHSINLMVLFLLSAFFPIIISSRTLLLYIILSALLIFHYLKKEIKIKQIILVCGISLAIILIFALFRPAQELNPELTFNDTPGLINSLVKSSIGNTNLLDITKTSQVVKNLGSSLDIKYGETLILWIYSPIPRTIWPEKPELDIGQEMEDKILKFGGKNPPGFIGELYWNFKLPGVVLGMFLLGLFLNFIYVNYKKHKTASSTLIYIFVLLNSTLTLLGNSLGLAIVGALTSVIPLSIVLSFIKKSKT